MQGGWEWEGAGLPSQGADADGPAGPGGAGQADLRWAPVISAARSRLGTAPRSFVTSGSVSQGAPVCLSSGHCWLRQASLYSFLLSLILEGPSL